MNAREEREVCDVEEGKRLDDDLSSEVVSEGKKENDTEVLTSRR